MLHQTAYSYSACLTLKSQEPYSIRGFTWSEVLQFVASLESTVKKKRWPPTKQEFDNSDFWTWNWVPRSPMLIYFSLVYLWGMSREPEILNAGLVTHRGSEVLCNREPCHLKIRVHFLKFYKNTVHGRSEQQGLGTIFNKSPGNALYCWVFRFPGNCANLFEVKPRMGWEGRDALYAPLWPVVSLLGWIV